MSEDIASYNGDRLLNTSVEDLVSYFEDKYKIEVPVLIEDEIVAEQSEAQIDVSQDPRRWIDDRSRPVYVPGARVTITIPFKGESEAFYIQPTTFNYNPPRADIRGQHLVLNIEGTDLNAEQVKSTIDRTINDIKGWLSNLSNNASQLNNSLADLARGQIEARRTKLLNNQSLVASLGFPLKERKDAPRTYAAPEVRRKVKPTPPPASSAPYTPEPALEISEYENILKILGNMAHVMELSPSAFRGMGEEDLRTHFLVQLNGHYEGNATGETFNYEGKTDILLRVNGKNIFIGECKFWGGPKKLLETLDQLLGYSSWRDTKVAVIIFSTRKDFSAVLDAIVPTVESHANCKRTIGQTGESSYRFIFAHKDDANRELTLTVQAYDVPTS